MNKFYLKIIIPSIVSVLLFILTIFLVIIPRFQQNILNGKKEMIKELTNSAWSILSKYEIDERKGLLTRKEAQETAISRIQYLRYGEENKDYFWITDMIPVMVMHPYREDLNGKDLSDLSDPHGKKIFVEFVKTVKESEHGYVDYMWQWKDDSLHIVPKLSYVKVFKPWGWVIGTGIYIEDVKKEISALTSKLIWISIGISFLIAFLLLFISQQSLKIERKRIIAENELFESKEKYKTLVEAATEGLIMLIDGKISFSNNVISQMTGFSNSELLDLSVSEIFSDNNSDNIINSFSKNTVKEGVYEINLKKKSGGFIEALITSSSAKFYHNAVHILIVKDVTIDRSSNLSSLDYQKLITSINLGFFRATIDTKGKFIFANENAVKILGYYNFKELSDVYILELLANSEDRKNLRKILLENGFVKNKVLKIHKKNNDYAMVSVTLFVFNSDNSGDLVCDGIIEDITFQENLKSDNEKLITHLKSSCFLIEQPIKDYVFPIISVDVDSTISEVVKVLETKKTDVILLTKNAKDTIGIITDKDIQKRVLTLKLDLENPAYLIMSSPVISATEGTSIHESINICESNNINHLVVKSNAGDIIGILRLDEIYKILKNSLSYLTLNIKKTETVEDIRKLYSLLQLLVKPLIRSDISVSYITAITSSFSDTVIARLIEIYIEEIGEPPVEFSFICLGSEGRKEETLYTDQDNAIIYNDVPKEKETIVNEYFNKLGEKVCNALDEIGYSFCKGNIMAKNQQWCKPISVWEHYFAGWITTPEPQNLLEATIFFDFRNVYGSNDLVERLRFSVGNFIKQQPVFIFHLASNTYNTKSPQIVTSNNEVIDLKNAVSLIVMFARTYALQNSIWHTNTLDRLNAIKEKQLIPSNTIDEIIFAYNFIMKLRFKNQIYLSENKMLYSNLLNTKTLIEIELSILKKALSLIPTYQNKLAIDFRLKQV